MIFLYHFLMFHHGTERLTNFVQLYRIGIPDIHIPEIHTFNLVKDASCYYLSLSYSKNTALFD